MAEQRTGRVHLVLGWDGLGSTAGLRRNTLGFDRVVARFA